MGGGSRRARKNRVGEQVLVNCPALTALYRLLHSARREYLVIRIPTSIEIIRSCRKLCVSWTVAKAISAGYQHTCAILDDDTLKCWGYNQMYGAVGVGSSDKYVWDPTEVKFDGSSSSGGSAGAPAPSGLNGTSGAPGSAGPKGDERTLIIVTLIIAVIWPVVLLAYFVRQRTSSPRATKSRRRETAVIRPTD